MKIYDFNGKKNISGERIREARIKMHLSQKALAVRLKLEGVELERDCISRIEIGTRFVADYEYALIYQKWRSKKPRFWGSFFV